MRFHLLLIFVGLVMPIFCLGNEGLWLPIHLKRLQGVDLQKMGLHLSPEEIYSINQASLKDAIVSFGGFCTAEVISKEGLLLTNHHCGYEAIWESSSLQHNHLEEGFWAYSKEDEIPSSGLSARFLVRMENVSQEVIAAIDPEKGEKERESQVEAISQSIINGVIDNTNYEADVKSFYAGNEYYLFIYQTYRDVRLVGTPPESIGRFGGDTDNWTWPRHTGDFSLFRVYTAQDGTPSEYSSTNLPLKSKYHIPISLEGVKEGDFTMVIGYPYKTQRYLPSYEVALATEQSNPHRVKLKERKLEILDIYLKDHPSERLLFAPRYRHISNFYKYYKNQNQVVKRNQVLPKKQQLEDHFREWCQLHPKQSEQYLQLDHTFREGYQALREHNLFYIYLSESIFGTEIFPFCYKFSKLSKLLSDKVPGNELDPELKELKDLSIKHFESYVPAVDQEITGALMELIFENLPQQQQPEILKTIAKKYRGDYQKWAFELFSNSMFSNNRKLDAFLEKPALKTLVKDPAYQVVREFLQHYYGRVAPHLKSAKQQLDQASRLWQKGLLEMSANQNHYPDANGSMRISLGQVESYTPQEAMHLHFQTTLDGLMAKENSLNPDYQIPYPLDRLYKNKDYHPYGEEGTVPVAFITNNDISAGSSGSPVLNGHGALVGISFDSNWEALSSDFYYEAKVHRSINVDIRFVLFIIDKFADADHLIDEMTIIPEKPATPEVMSHPQYPESIE